MRNLIIIIMLVTTSMALAQEKGPADDLWPLYQEGRFEEVVAQGKALLAGGTETAALNLAVGRSLVDLERFEEGVPYLTKAVDQDPGKSWVYAWGQVYLGAAHFKLGDEGRARQAWRLGRDAQATRNATRNAANNLLAFGLSEFFDDWKSFDTEHFSFRFSGRLKDLDRVEYARVREQAYTKIAGWFGGGPEQKIRFMVWADQAEADEAGMPDLGFAKPELHLIHSLVNQTVGHEMTHVISHHAMKPQSRTGLINEGTAVHMDQTGRDQLERARSILAASDPRPPRVSIPALWEDWSLAPGDFSYPLAGAWVARLIEKGGKEKFLEFYADQRYAHAREVFGSDLNKWAEEFETELYIP